MAFLYSLDDIHRVTRTLVEVAGAANLQDEKVARLLAQWATSSTHARHQFAEAIRIADPAVHRNAVQAAVTTYSQHLFPPEETVHLLVDIAAPKSAWSGLSQHFTRQAVGYAAASHARFPRPLCTRTQFQAAWESLCAPMQLVHTCSGNSEALTWPLEQWEEYINSRPPLCIPAEGPLHLIVRGDAYPVAGTSWSHMTISLGNHGANARKPAFCWPIAIANCPDKDMAALGILWQHQIQVPPFETCTSAHVVPCVQLKAFSSSAFSRSLQNTCVHGNFPN
jgi:hypothetical protein